MGSTNSLLFLLFFLIPSTCNSSYNQTIQSHHKTTTTHHHHHHHHQEYSEDREDHHQVAQYQVFYLKNTTPFLLHDDVILHKQLHQPAIPNMNSNKINISKMRRSRLTVMMIKKRRKINTNDKKKKSIKKYFKNRPAGPFSVMLPKGFVPPSSSSPCHNDLPDSTLPTSFCDLSAHKP